MERIYIAVSEHHWGKGFSSLAAKLEAVQAGGEPPFKIYRLPGQLCWHGPEGKPELFWDEPNDVETNEEEYLQNYFLVDLEFEGDTREQRLRKKEKFLEKLNRLCESDEKIFGEVFDLGGMDL